MLVSQVYLTWKDDLYTNVCCTKVVRYKHQNAMHGQFSDVTQDGGLIIRLIQFYKGSEVTIQCVVGKQFYFLFLLASCPD